MSQTVKIHGELSAGPDSCSGSSGSPALLVQLDEAISVKGVPNTSEYELSSDSPQSVAFGGLASASVVLIKATGGKVRVRLTSADGTSQAIPVDSLLLILSESVAYTAIDLTRVSGTLTTVAVTLAEKAA